MNRKLVAVVALGSLAGAQLAFTGTSLSETLSYQSTNIYMNGQEVASAQHIVAADPYSKISTSWLPVFYLETSLKKAGISNGWNNGRWNIQTSSSQKVDMSNLPKTHTLKADEMQIEVNGTVVAYAPRISAPDPASKVNTSYAPMYYVMNALKRLSVNPTWDGTNWRMATAEGTGQGSSQGSSGSNPGSRSTGELTQQDMANSMWSILNATTLFVHTHATMNQAGVTLDNPTANVTAGNVATWLADWAAVSKGYTPPAGPQAGQFVPFSLKYEVSTDPYTWAAYNDLFEGTKITGPNTVISPSDKNVVLDNLKWWLNGYRYQNGTYQIHALMDGDFIEWDEFVNVNKVINEQQYQATLAEATKYLDRVTMTVSGRTINLALGDTTNSQTALCWEVTDSYFYYGWDGKGSEKYSRGGKTLAISNDGKDLEIDLLSTHNQLAGLCWRVENSNGKPDFTHLVDAINNQQQQ